jgi:hypothetical protein
VVTVYTTAGAAAYPDLSPFGIAPPPAGATVSWSVGARGPSTSVDDYLASPAALLADGWGTFAPAVEIRVQ